MTRFLAALGRLTLTLGCGVVMAEAPAGRPDAPEITRLANGLRVVIVEDRRAPVVSISVAYRVGAAQDPPHLAGLAHFVEHLTFRSFEALAGARRLEWAIAAMHGATSFERTLYTSTLPAAQLDAGLLLESVRMSRLAVSPDSFELERARVLDEQAGRAASVNAVAAHQVSELVSTGEWSGPVAGSAKSIAAIGPQDAARFFEQHYTPTNAVLVIVGDVERANALERVNAHFAQLPRRPPAQTAGNRAVADGGRSRRLTEARNFSGTRIDVAYRLPAGDHPDTVIAQVVRHVLCGRPDARLNHSLAAWPTREVKCWVLELPGNSLFRISVVFNVDSKQAATYETRLLETIERSAGPAPAERELIAARAYAERVQAQEMQNSRRRSARMAEYVLFYGDSGLSQRSFERFLSASPDEVARVAATLTPARALVKITTEPSARTGSANLVYSGVAALCCGAAGLAWVVRRRRNHVRRAA